MTTTRWTGAIVAAALCTVVVATGCNEVPYCIGDCTDAGADTGLDPASDSAGDASDTGMDGDGPSDTFTEVDTTTDTSTDVPADGEPVCDPVCEGGQVCCQDTEGPVCVDTSSHLNHCGECGNRCQLPNAYNACEDGVCSVASCDVNFLDCREDDPLIPATWGCETVCFATSPADAVCDHIDNDCDCVADEDVDLVTDPDNCGQCGERCRFAAAEDLCESSDGTPAGAECVMGPCEDGYWDENESDLDGCEYECSACETAEGSCGAPPATCCTASGDETCNGIDDDCDGDIDEGDPQSGGTCGTDVGECATGTLHCDGGALACQGDTGPTQETCNGLDDDCDGPADEPDAGSTYLPDENQVCNDSGLGSVGDCEYGLTECNAGTLDCVGDVGPVAEICDGHDNDCDGTPDDGLPAGAPCGTDVGECDFGNLQCVAGSEVCLGGDDGTVEACNDLDDDCDALVDEDFLFAVDPNNCGQCGRRCSSLVSAHAIAICSGGSCQVVGCEPSWWPGPAEGCTSGMTCCSTFCEYTGNEVCDGVDNDCDTLVDQLDPGFVTVGNFCPQTGACAGSSPVCETRCGAKGWYCNYGPGVYVSTDCMSIDPESSGRPCDDVDNDCDGAVDEHLALKGTSCTVGTGLCTGTGSYVCSASSLVCDAVEGTGTSEACNGLDDDCNGLVDDFSNTAYTIIGAVNVGGVRIFQYEASRPNAASCSAGTETYSGTTLTSKACSKDGVLPWTNISWNDARRACQNLGTGWDLCTAAQWQNVCRSASGYTYPYGNTYQATTCNGNDFDTDCPCGGTCSSSGDNDEILDTGDMSACCSNFSGTCVYDMSGNVKEWTSTWRLSQDSNGDTTPENYYEIRGGASNQPAAGLTCNFNFTIASQLFAFFNLGFRCCHP